MGLYVAIAPQEETRRGSLGQLQKKERHPDPHRIGGEERDIGGLAHVWAEDARAHVSPLHPEGSPPPSRFSPLFSHGPPRPSPPSLPVIVASCFPPSLPACLTLLLGFRRHLGEMEGEEKRDSRMRSALAYRVKSRGIRKTTREDATGGSPFPPFSLTGGRVAREREVHSGRCSLWYSPRLPLGFSFHVSSRKFRGASWELWSFSDTRTCTHVSYLVRRVGFLHRSERGSCATLQLRSSLGLCVFCRTKQFIFKCSQLFFEARFT